MPDSLKISSNNVQMNEKYLELLTVACAEPFLGFENFAGLCRVSENFALALHSKLVILAPKAPSEKFLRLFSDKWMS